MPLPNDDRAMLPVKQVAALLLAHLNRLGLTYQPDDNVSTLALSPPPPCESPPPPHPQGKVPLSLDGAVVLLGGETSLPKIHHSLTGLWVKEVAVGEDMAIVVDKGGRLWQISLKEQGQPEVGGALRGAGHALRGDWAGHSEGWGAQRAWGGVLREGGVGQSVEKWLCWFPSSGDQM